jgi:hypothetical protein
MAATDPTVQLTRLTNHIAICGVAQSVQAAIKGYLTLASTMELNEILEGLRGYLPPEILYSIPVLSEAHTMYGILRNYLVGKGGTYTQHPSTKRVVWGLVKTLYGDDQNACSMAYNSLRRAAEIAAG